MKVGVVALRVAGTRQGEGGKWEEGVEETAVGDHSTAQLARFSPGK